MKLRGFHTHMHAKRLCIWIIAPFKKMGVLVFNNTGVINVCVRARLVGWYLLGWHGGAEA